MIRIALIDDHPIVLDGIAANLEDAGDIDIVARGERAADALRIAEEVQPGVMVLDLELPDRNGLTLIRELKALPKSPRIVIFTAYGGANRVAQALTAGAESYVVKGTSFDELLMAIREANRGRRRLAPEIAAALAESYGAPEALTEREREILALLAQGRANKEIAARLHITERTVKFHVSQILARLGADNRTHAITIAQERGLL
jgi:DNA-binding NarL/FixJ family response regulator